MLNVPFREQSVEKENSSDWEELRKEIRKRIEERYFKDPSSKPKISQPSDGQKQQPLLYK